MYVCVSEQIKVFRADEADCSKRELDIGITPVAQVRLRRIARDTPTLTPSIPQLSSPPSPHPAPAAEEMRLRRRPPDPLPTHNHNSVLVLLCSTLGKTLASIYNINSWLFYLFLQFCLQFHRLPTMVGTVIQATLQQTSDLLERTKPYPSGITKQQRKCSLTQLVFLYLPLSAGSVTAAVMVFYCTPRTAQVSGTLH